MNQDPPPNRQSKPGLEAWKEIKRLMPIVRRQQKRWKEREFRKTFKKAEKFYGRAAMKSRKHLLMPTGLIHRLANPLPPNQLGPRIYGGEYVLAPKKEVLAFFKKHRCSFRGQQKAQFFQLPNTQPTFLPTVSFTALITSRAPENRSDWILSGRSLESYPG